MSTSGLPGEQAIEAATEAIHFRHRLGMDESESLARTALAAIGGASIAMGHMLQMRVNMEKLFAHAAAIGVGEAVVHELVKAEQSRAEVSIDPFSWDRVKNQMNDTLGINRESTGHFPYTL